MDPAVWSASTRRAWMVGVGLAVVGGVISAGVGTFAGLCCLFQFANILVPVLAGLVGGALGAGLAPWDQMPVGTGPSGGATLGLRGGGIAAVGAGIIGFLASLLFPLLEIAIRAIADHEDVVQSLTMAAVGLVFSMVEAVLFAGIGAILGVLLAAAAGAVAGAAMGPK